MIFTLYLIRRAYMNPPLPLTGYEYIKWMGETIRCSEEAKKWTINYCNRIKNAMWFSHLVTATREQSWWKERDGYILYLCR